MLNNSYICLYKTVERPPTDTEFILPTIWVREWTLDPICRLFLCKMKIPKNLSRAGFHNHDVPELEWVNEERINNIVSVIRPIVKKIKSINYRVSSYGIKHDVERRIGYYVSNGELIAAMIILGFEYKRPIGSAGINCYFNVSMKSLKLI